MKKSWLNNGEKAIYDYTLFLAAIYIIYFFIGITSPDLLTAAGITAKTTSLIVDFVLIVFILYFIYLLKNKSKKTFLVGTSWYALSAIATILFAYNVDKNIFPLLKDLLILSSVFIVAINFLVVWFLVKKRHYFKAFKKEKQTKKQKDADSIFAKSIIIMWGILIIISFFLGAKSYSHTTRLADSMMDEFSGLSLNKAILLCEEKQGEEKDVCFVVLAATYRDVEGLCDRIGSGFYRFVCRQA